jgi:hypothetical protein
MFKGSKPALCSLFTGLTVSALVGCAAESTREEEQGSTASNVNKGGKDDDLTSPASKA